MTTPSNVQVYKGTLRSKELWQHYFDEFESLKDQPINLLELGVFYGRSLRMWEDYFTEGSVSGLDERIPIALRAGPRVRFFQGNQQDTELLDHVARTVAPKGFDIIIDDCSHIGRVTKVTFWHLFEHHLKPGGIYVIEDWQTGYMGEWEDGETLSYDPRDVPPEGNRFHGHQVGMVGFVKELVDELARHSFGMPNGGDARRNQISQLRFFQHQVFVYKQESGEAIEKFTDAA